MQGLHDRENLLTRKESSGEEFPILREFGLLLESTVDPGKAVLLPMGQMIGVLTLTQFSISRVLDLITMI